MRVTRLFGVAVLVAAAGLAHASAQQAATCTLKVSQAPQLRGLRLGMTTSELVARYPRMTPPRANDLGQAKLSFDGLKDFDAVAFEGVNSVLVNFIDDRLVEFAVHYEGKPWDDMDQFLAQFRESLKLPAGWAGEGQGQGHNVRSLSCDGFRIETGPDGWAAHWLMPWVRVWQPGAEDVVERRAAEKRERQRRAFKP